MPESEPQRLTQQGFEDLYAHLGPRLLSFLTRQAGNADLASDLLQETFLRILRSPVRVFSDGELRGYAYRTAYSVVTDHFRREQRARRWSFFTGRSTPVKPEPAGDMNRVFGKLNHRERSLLWMAYVEEMNHEEIAAALGVKPRTVKVLLHRARKRLGDMLRKLNLGPEALQ
jgi:RNA polymerase sigma-70 factor (ECF subfamily)